ncbi:MAG: T9SS type A sorting domain-containing protein, partial [Calditrichaeota bacterium]|nr:T9SS type A sorting domain-containing protein [Calditrichota bacterium]
AAFPHSPLTASVLEYDPDSDTWRERDPIPTARALFAAVIVDNLLYAIGGSTTSFPFTPTNAVEAYAYMVGIGDGPNENIVEKFTLHDNFPNPFNPTTAIAFDLPTNGFATLKIFDLAGHEVAELASGQLAAGAHQVQWNAGGFASGVYFYQLQVSQNQREQFTQTKKMMLIK